MKNIKIRLETQDDYRETEVMVREAFWNVYKPGCNEHLILHKLRKVSAFVEELGLVACYNNKIVGNIIYSEAKVINNQNKKSKILCMGPLAVLPSYQEKGIGSLLMKESISKAKLLGYKAVVIFGNPNYYHRFGFENAEKYDIQTADGDNFDAFMVLELYDGSLNDVEGKFLEDPVFLIKDEEVELFDKKFPYKEKHVTDTQLK